MSHNKMNKCALAVKLGLVVGAAAFAMPALALQTAAASGANAQDANIEVIEVRGIRRSLNDSVNSKRFANAVVDSISAEDIGKLPDNNVAESLGRIPGVSVSRQFGEGDAVSIRGASNQLTLTTLNGQNIASAGWYSQQAIDRSFNYSMLAPEMIGSINVYKSSQADLLEGGVGGTVVVNTRKPLELDSFTAFGSYKATQSSATDDTDGSASGLLSWKNDAETFGILGSLAKSDFTLERRGNEALPSWGGRIAPTHFRQERERTAYDVTAQYAPSEAVEFGVHALKLELGADSVNTQIWIPQDLDSCASKNAQKVPTKCTNSAAWSKENHIYYDVRPRNATMETESVTTNLIYKGEGYKLEAKVGKSRATGGTNFETNLAYLSGIGSPVGTIDATGKVVQFNFAPFTVNLPEKGNYAGWEGLQSGAVVNQPRSDEEQFAQVDYEFDTDFSVVNSIKVGARVTDHDVAQDANRPIAANYDGEAQAKLLNGAQFVQGTVTGGMDHFNMPKPNAGAIIDYTKAMFPSWAWAQDRSGYGTVNEKNNALYVMANLQGENFRGNVGLRYVQTDASAMAYQTDVNYVNTTGLVQNNIYTPTLVKTEGDYSKLLPSLNLAYDLNADTIVRFSASKVMARPNYDDMFSIKKLNGFSDNIPNNETMVTGNPNLQPFSATQADVGVEWYFAPSSMVAASVFWKKIGTFTTFSSLANQKIGVVSPDTKADNWLIQSKKDGDGGKVTGLELQAMHAFGNGFGVQGNYTLANASAAEINYPDRNDTFSDSSKHSVNAVAFYENEYYSARAAYTWRSEYMIRETGFYGAREHQDYGSLDLSFTYKFNDNLTLLADVTNLLEEDSVQIGKDQTQVPTFWRTSNGYPAYTYEGEARYSVGVQYRF